MNKKFSLEVVKEDVVEQLRLSREYYETAEKLVHLAGTREDDEMRRALMKAAEEIYNNTQRLVENANRLGVAASKFAE
ncbi:MAG: hypothetical protein ACLGJC_09110 [Alphaproteobacteria bacterium]